MTRTLILGGTGFIGLNLARRLAGLAAPNDEILLTDNFSRGRRDEEVEDLLGRYKSTVRLEPVDLSAPGAYERFHGAFDSVYLLASMVGVGPSERAPDEVMRVNTSIILGALEWMARSGSGRMFFSSTSENYAGGVQLGIVPIPTPEDVPLVISDIRNPRFSYAVTKIWGEAACIFYGARHGFTSIIGRYHNVYGPRMGWDHVIPQLTRRIVCGEKPLRVKSPDQTRAFCHVSDAVEATRLIMQSTAVENGMIVHIGNDREEIAIGTLAKNLLVLAGRSEEVEAAPAPRGSVARRVPDISLLRRLTGFEPRIPISQGLAETFAWYRQHPQPEEAS